MPKLVVMGAKMSCSQGTSPSSLTLTPRVGNVDQIPAATVDDYQPTVNVAPFGMCITQANPQVASATAAAQGVLTPQPCMPVITAAWSPGASVTTFDNVKALTDDSTCNCQWTGSISITDPASQVEVG